MYRYLFTFLLLAGFAPLETPDKSKNKPNILFIAVDDLRPDLGAYGNKVVHSPNIDALANAGSLFTNHYVQVPTCGASRHALLTGMLPKKPIHLGNRAIEVEISGQPEKPVPETFIHRFKREGYHTVGIGKISHSADGMVYGYEEQPSTRRELPHSWSELLFDAGKWKTGWNAFFAYANGENRQSLKKQVKPYEAGQVGDDGYPDGLTTDLAIAKLKELKQGEKPFFMGVGLFKPHLPFNAPQKYWDLYRRDEIPLSTNPDIPENISLKSLHESGEFNQYALGEEKAGLSHRLSDDYARKLRHAYFASVSYVDAQIGKLWKTLQALDLDENTIIVIWSDHGWHLGDQRVWGKHTLFENALKSPLIIKSPLLNHQNKKVTTIAETVDVYPTLLELCGISLDHDIDGQSLVDAMKAEKNEDNQTAHSYYRDGISVRTPHYRLTKYFRKEGPVIELYDHTKGNSQERRNIAEEHPEIVTKLLPLLEEGNTGLYAEKKID